MGREEKLKGFRQPASPGGREGREGDRGGRLAGEGRGEKEGETEKSRGGGQLKH